MQSWPEYYQHGTVIKRDDFRGFAVLQLNPNATDFIPVRALVYWEPYHSNKGIISFSSEEQAWEYLSRRKED